MTQHDETVAADVRAAMARITKPAGAIRDLSIRSGISEPTLRKIAETGIVASRRTAAALEAATDGEIPAARSVQPNARGNDLYTREPGVSILREALRRHVGVGDVLHSLGLTHQDLWSFAHLPDGQGEAVKSRVRAALRLAGFDVASGAEQ